MKKILITGANSYIGTSFEKWVSQYENQYIVDTLDMIRDTWKEKDFSSYDVIFHVAGIVHVSANFVAKSIYYKVNRDLAIETAEKAKKDGIKQFIFMSSMGVYDHCSKKVIDYDAKPKPNTLYGKSKLKAEEQIVTLQDEKFNVVIVRPPMIYGKGCKGNYPKLSKIACLLPLFPNIENERSMLHIDNLCEFIRLMIENEERGLFFPQNEEYVKTAEMVRIIAEVYGKKIALTKIFNSLFKKMERHLDIINKVFGDFKYEKSLSKYRDNYQVCNLIESIKRSERVEYTNVKKIFILSNHDVYLYNFRRELIDCLLHSKYKVYISSPYGERIKDLIKMGCHYIEVSMTRHGTNIIEEYNLLKYYKKIIKEIKPDVVLSYTIKPNIYGGIACRMLNVPYIANITGLGTAVENDGIMKKISIILYKNAFNKVSCVFFQNEENKQFFLDNKIIKKKYRLIPGSGVNLEHFNVIEYPPENTIEFVFISRIMKEKGIEEYLETARYITKKYPKTRFHICGFCEEVYEEKLKQLQDEGTILYHGMLHDVREIIQKTHCTIHPTYYPEGLSNVLLESAACGRPIITTDRSGCREVVDNGINGYMVRQREVKDLIEKTETFINLDYIAKKKMGLEARKKVEKEFDRNIVVEAYMSEINKLLSK